MDSFERTYFAVTVRVWRRRADLTLKELEELTGISAATLNRIELDERIPTILELERLCHIMDENCSTFFRTNAKENYHE